MTMFRVIVMFAAFSMYQQSHVHVAPFGEKFKIEKELLLVNVNGCHIGINFHAITKHQW